MFKIRVLQFSIFLTLIIFFGLISNVRAQDAKCDPENNMQDSCTEADCSGIFKTDPNLQYRGNTNKPSGYTCDASEDIILTEDKHITLNGVDHVISANGESVRLTYELASYMDSECSGISDNVDADGDKFYGSCMIFSYLPLNGQNKAIIKCPSYRLNGNVAVSGNDCLCEQTPHTDNCSHLEEKYINFNNSFFTSMTVEEAKITKSELRFSCGSNKCLVNTDDTTNSCQIGDLVKEKDQFCYCCQNNYGNLGNECNRQTTEKNGQSLVTYCTGTQSNAGLDACRGSIDCANCIARKVDGGKFRDFTEAAQEQLKGQIKFTNNIYTAIGCVDPSQEGISVRIMQIGLGIVGGIIVIRFGQASFYLQMADPESQGEGSKLVVSALLALVMMVFSVIGLRFIGVDVLKILSPGTIEIEGAT